MARALLRSGFPIRTESTSATGPSGNELGETSENVSAKVLTCRSAIEQRIMNTSTTGKVIYNAGPGQSYRESVTMNTGTEH